MSDVVVNIRAEDNFSGVLGNFGSIVTGIESAIRLAADAFRIFGGFAMEGLEAIASYERMGASLQSLVASQLLMNGAAKDMASAMDVGAIAAEKLLGWIQEVAIKSPFTQEGVAQAFRMAMAYGFTTEEAKRLTQALIDFAAGSGATEYAMQAISRALGQISATGKVTGGDMLQLVNAGLPVTQILADGFGVTTAKIMEMREKGLLPAKESIEMITEYLENNFKGAGEAQSLTWAGLMGTFEDLKAMGLREFFGGLFDVIQPLAVEFSTWLQSEGMDKIGEWGAALGEFTQNVIDKIPGVITVISDLKDAFTTGGLDDVFANIFNEISNSIDAWVNSGGPKELTAAIIGFISDIGKGTEFQSGALAAAQDMLESLINALDKVDWNRIDVKFANVISAIDFSGSGDAFGKSLAAFFGAGVESNKSLAVEEIAKGLKEWVFAAFDAIEIAVTEGIRDMDGFKSLQAVGEALVEGIKTGFDNGIGGLFENATIFWDRFITHVKNILGIASPSTVFMSIGRDIVFGLIAGFSSAIGGFISLVSGFIDYILGIFAPFLEILGIDIGGGSGGVGDHDPGRTTPGTPSTGASGTTVNQYFAGATINVGSWDEIIYDCVYPNPFIGSTSGQLTGGGGGTGAPR
jgi:tape measure domain-containing protein